jgi:hypothetical protein
MTCELARNQHHRPRPAGRAAPARGNLRPKVSANQYVAASLRSASKDGATLATQETLPLDATSSLTTPIVVGGRYAATLGCKAARDCGVYVADLEARIVSFVPNRPGHLFARAFAISNGELVVGENDANHSGPYLSRILRLSVGAVQSWSWDLHVPVFGPWSDCFSQPGRFKGIPGCERECTKESVGGGLIVTVRDERGEVICDARVVARDGFYVSENTTPARDATSCWYTVARGRPGIYTVTVERDGFTPTTQSAVVSSDECKVYPTALDVTMKRNNPGLGARLKLPVPFRASHSVVPVASKTGPVRASTRAGQTPTAFCKSSACAPKQDIGASCGDTRASFTTCGVGFADRGM